MSALLEVRDLEVQFRGSRGVTRAVDSVSFAVERGRTLGVVGESGSGKSVSMLALLGLLPPAPACRVQGRAELAGVDLLAMSPGELRATRGRRVGLIFQDPMTALNPYLRVSTQLTEVLTTHARLTAKAARRRAIAALEQVGIADAARRIDDYPHQFSGGMRQRVVIAMALIAEPELVIADEPTTALDVTVQAQVLELLRQLQKDLGLAMILITHDLGVVAQMSDDIAVMYAGRIVEHGAASDVFRTPRHPYTSALLQSIPRLDAAGNLLEMRPIPGLPPDPARLPQGCPFAPRCAHASSACAQLEIPRPHVTTRHWHACTKGAVS